MSSALSNLSQEERRGEKEGRREEKEGGERKEGKREKGERSEGARWQGKGSDVLNRMDDRKEDAAKRGAGNRDASVTAVIRTF